MDDDLGGIAIIRVEGWQRSQGLHTKTLFGRLSGFPMLPAVGDFVQPLAHLTVHVRQVGERAQRPELRRRYPIARSIFPFSQAAAT